MGLGTGERNRIAKRAAAEISDGMLVNLGIGIPSLVPNHLWDDRKVMFHAENGLVGMGSTPETGKEDAHLCNAGDCRSPLEPGLLTATVLLHLE